MAEKHASLVEVHKDGASLHVHPDTLDAHVGAGWQVAAVQTPADPEPADAAASHRPEAVEPKHAAKPKRS